jgi:hypothetical protein
MQTLDREAEVLMRRIERAVRAAKLQRKSQEECRRQYYLVRLAEREQEVELGR